VQTFDGRPWRGIVDIVAGGFPCQDISVAGKGAGIDGAKSGMWGHMARIIGEVRPRYVFVENSPALITRGLGRVLGDLAALGYDCRWTVLGAADVGAPHQRDRFWLVANASSGRFSKQGGWEMEQPRGAKIIGSSIDETMADANSLWQLQPQRRQRYQWGWPDNGAQDMANANQARQQDGAGGGKNEEFHRVGTADNASGGIGAPDGWPPEPDVGRMVDGVAFGMDRLKALGNGQVPACAAAAWRILNAP
jgi:DNA (cytosine-5)-methyltransferase 1